MNINFMRIDHPEDPVVFVSARLDGEQVRKIIQNNKSGVETPSIDQDLAQGCYIPVLSAVWGERDAQKRLTWLKKYTDERHAPLIYEQALAEFVVAPSIDTIVNVSLPLIRAASFLVTLSAACSTDVSIRRGDAYEIMEGVYNKSLKRAIAKYLPQEQKIRCEKELNLRREEIEGAIKAKIAEIVQAAFNNAQAFAKPDWVAFHGINMFIEGKPSLCDPADYAAKRQELIKEIFPKLSLNITPPWL